MIVNFFHRFLLLISFIISNIVSSFFVNMKVKTESEKGMEEAPITTV